MGMERKGCQSIIHDHDFDQYILCRQCKLDKQITLDSSAMYNVGWNEYITTTV